MATVTLTKEAKKFTSLVDDKVKNAKIIIHVNIIQFLIFQLRKLHRCDAFRIFHVRLTSTIGDVKKIISEELDIPKDFLLIGSDFYAYEDTKHINADFSEELKYHYKVFFLALCNNADATSRKIAKKCDITIRRSIPIKLVSNNKTVLKLTIHEIKFDLFHEELERITNIPSKYQMLYIKDGDISKAKLFHTKNIQSINLGIRYDTPNYDNVCEQNDLKILSNLILIVKSLTKEHHIEMRKNNLHTVRNAKTCLQTVNGVNARNQILLFDGKEIHDDEFLFQFLGEQIPPATKLVLTLIISYQPYEISLQLYFDCHNEKPLLVKDNDTVHEIKNNIKETWQNDANVSFLDLSIIGQPASLDDDKTLEHYSFEPCWKLQIKRVLTVTLQYTNKKGEDISEQFPYILYSPNETFHFLEDNFVREKTKKKQAHWRIFRKTKSGEQVEIENKHEELQEVEGNYLDFIMSHEKRCTLS